MNDSTIPAPPLSLHDALARRYIRDVHRMAQRRPLPLDHSAPPRGLPCVPPPAMPEGTS